MGGTSVDGNLAAAGLAGQFDDLAELYEEFSRQPFRQELEFPSVLAALGDVSGLRVLDFGCGSGVYTRKLAGLGAAVTGVDESRGMVAYAQRREQDDPVGARYLAGPVPAELAGTMDVVLGVYVLPYTTTIAELTGLCRTAADALRPGGVFVTLPIHPRFHRDGDYYAPYGFRLRESERNDGSPVVLDLRALGHEATVTARYWTEDTLNAVLGEVGFETVDWLPHRTSAAETDVSAMAYFRPYLSVPHAALLRCVKGKARL
ncbi:class I SAM-dependent methyltransferase [Amycolatopsis mongoliensis]|uniref:Class I SAM-dependent methyltransferase n=1 Tax=Amycolatopsis mongoliensis TaxID=715475 RepID=A0A9Y2JM01_9PSEU|nr:class I SAM-dependent methyltransferase [Amycolatopsis sp. 4-36]WIY00980.1 class I SAM-dependent methyltransferase [Amycolatopsis sp. 4-36]